MAARETTILLSLLLLALRCCYAAAYVECTPIGGGKIKPTSRSKVIGSTDVTKGSTPWMVSIQTSKYSKLMHLCGGVIINQEFVLTSAHCVDGENVEYLLVASGDYNLTDCDGDEEIREVSFKIIHPYYDSYSRDYNIALLHVKHKFWRTPNVKPIAFLRNPEPYTLETCEIVGWGAVTQDGAVTDVLKGSNQTVLEEQDCKYVFSSLITDNMFCASDFVYGGGPCQGDWGGPLVCRGRELCGIASWGAGCGSTYYPTVYTNVTYFYDWVDSIAHLKKDYRQKHRLD